jgi:hypothetical protein
MWSRQRSVGTRVGRGLILTVGVLGGLVAFDAILLFLVLLAAALVIAPPNPYIGLFMFVGVPILVVLGTALAWIAYRVLRDRAPEADGEGHEVHV